MAETNDNSLRALIRFIPPVRALKDDLEESLQLELYEGTGDLAVQSFKGLQAGIAAVANDPYVAALTLNVAENATDKEKLSLVRLAAGQLAAYLEGQTGLASAGGGSVNRTIQTAPNIAINGINGLPAETIEKIINMGAKALETGKEPSSGSA